jgi:hypothetical protein
VTTIHRIPLPPDAPEPEGIGTRVVDGEGNLWEKNTHGSWTGPNTLWREWWRVARVGPLHLLVVSDECLGQADLFEDVNG